MSGLAMSDVWKPAPAALSIFEAVARLYVAADTAIAHIVLEAGECWSLDFGELPSSGVAIWGNTPSSGQSLPLMVRWAAKRERGLRRLRSGVGNFTIRDVHRLPPPRRAGMTRGALRSTLLSGLMVELRAGGKQWRIIDAVAAASGADRRSRVRLRPSRDGSALARLMGEDGIPFELRVATFGGRKDPERNADALAALMSAGVPLVPHPYRRGETAGASWTSESVLGGGIPKRLTRNIVSEVIELCAALPRAEEPTSLRDRMLQLRDRSPRWSALAGQLAETAVPDVPAMVQHGDLWSGNLLVSGGHLSGVVDWDTWHPAGLPGVDLLQLFSMHRRARTGEGIGDLWLSGLWRSPEFLSATSKYWKLVGVRPNVNLLEALSLDWWAGQLLKRQALAVNPEWVERNVDAVLDAVNGRR